MPIHSRVTQDRRRLSRIMALTACEFTHAKGTSEALLVDLSLNGAFIASKVLPPIGSTVRISLQKSSLKNPLTVDGTVIRGGWGMSETGEVGRFGVRFHTTPPDLIHLLKDLASPKEEPVPGRHTRLKI